MRPLTLDPAIVKHQIDNLLVQCPELADDEILRTDMIEGETDAFEFLRLVERKRQDACAMAGGIAGNIAELELRQARFERREQAMRDLHKKIMEAANLKKVELPEATLSLRNGSQKLIGESDPEMLPREFQKISYKEDRAAIKAALDAGRTLAGYSLSNGEPTIAIRTK